MVEATVDLDYLMQAGAQVKTKEDRAWFKTIAAKYGERVQVPALTEAQAREEAVRQTPKGSTLTYLVEEREGVWKAYYSPEKKGKAEERQPQFLAPSMVPGFAETLSGMYESVVHAPSVFEVRNPLLAPLGLSTSASRSGQAIPITTEEVFMGAVALASITAPIIQRKFWQTSQQKYYQAMSKMSKELYRPTGLEKAGIQRSASGEMWLNVQQPYETVQTQPREQFYRITRGTPTTPMSKTLEAAIYGKAKGGLSADYLLVPRSTWSMPPALKELRMLPKLYPTSHTIPVLLPSFLLGQGQRQATSQLLQLSQVQALTQVQALIQKQAQQLRQRTQQALAMTTPNIPRTITKQVPRFPNLRLPRPNYYSKIEKDLFGKWSRKTHKLRTPKQAMTLFGMSNRKRKMPRMPNL